MIDKLIALLVPQLELIYFGMIILGCVVLARIISSTLKNVYVLSYKFDWKWFLEGFLKGGAFAVAVFFATVSAAWFPTFLELAGITSADMSKVVSTIAITIIIAAAISKYFAETVKNFMLYLGLSQEDVDGYVEIDGTRVGEIVPVVTTTVTAPTEAEVMKESIDDPSALAG